MNRFSSLLKEDHAKTDDVVTNVVERRTLGQSANIGVYTGLGKPRQLDRTNRYNFRCWPSYHRGHHTLIEVRSWKLTFPAVHVPFDDLHYRYQGLTIIFWTAGLSSASTVLQHEEQPIHTTKTDVEWYSDNTGALSCANSNKTKSKSHSVPTCS